MKTRNKILLIAAILFSVNYLGWFAHGNSQMDQESCSVIYKNKFMKKASLRAIDIQSQNIDPVTRIFKAGAIQGFKDSIETCYLSGNR